MPPEEEHLSRFKPPDDGLESYRRLIELQKQMIELSQHYEQSKRECNALREQVARELAHRPSGLRTLRRRMQQSANRLVQFVHRLGSGEAKLNVLNPKQEISC